MDHTTAADGDDEHLVALLHACAGGDGGALEQLYRRVSPALFACLLRILARRSLAEEALQDVFVTVWRRAGQFRPERGRPMAWLIAIARYRAIDLLRHERTSPTLVANLPDQADIAAEPVDEPMSWLPGGALLERCLALLTHEQRRCLELAFVGGNSHGDIARLVGTPLGTVKTWIRRGLKTLKGCLES